MLHWPATWEEIERRVGLQVQRLVAASLTACIGVVPNAWSDKRTRLRVDCAETAGSDMSALTTSPPRSVMRSTRVTTWLV